MRNHDFAHVLWIGGSVCSGKTSAAKDLASRYGLRIYSFDRAERVDIFRSVPERQPTRIRFMAMTDNRCALWLVATPDCIRQVRTVRGEGVSQATSDPRRAFENLVAGDVLMAEHIRHEADRLGLPVVSADADSLLGIAAIIERHFASQLPGVC